MADQPKPAIAEKKVDAHILPGHVPPRSFHVREKSAVEKNLLPVALGAGGLLFGGMVGVFVHPLAGGVTALGILVCDYWLLVRPHASHQPGTPVDPELEKKKDLLQQMDFLEKQFLKHELDETSFHSLRDQKERELIAIEAKLSQSNAQKNAEEENQLAKMEDVKLRNELARVFEQRHALQAEMEIAQNHFLKRKIDSKAYAEMTKDHQKKLAEIESAIQSFSKKTETERILSELKKDLARLDAAKPPTPKRNPVLAQALAEEQLADQITHTILTRYRRRDHP